MVQTEYVLLQLKFIELIILFAYCHGARDRVRLLLGMLEQESSESLDF